MKLLALSVVFFVELLWIARVNGEPDWIYNIIELNSTNKTPELFDINIYLKRISRGHFVVAGSITVGVDLTDETKVYGELFYSRTAQHFVRTSFHIPIIPLSTFFNQYYKDLFMEGSRECATNAPLYDESETFVPPWRKSVIVLENCTFPNDNMPSHLRPGFYKIILVFTQQVETTLTILAQIEPRE